MYFIVILIRTNIWLSQTVASRTWARGWNEWIWESELGMITDDSLLHWGIEDFKELCIYSLYNPFPSAFSALPEVMGLLRKDHKKLIPKPLEYITKRNKILILKVCRGHS